MLKLATICTLLALSMTTACPFGPDPDGDTGSERGDRGDRGDDGDNNNNNNNNGGGGGGDVCSVPDDCPNTVCYCVKNQGDFPSPVNSRRCINNRCALPRDSCDSVCSGFGMTWNGQSEVLRNSDGNNNNNNNNGGDNNGGNNGPTCPYENDDECDDSTGSGACVDGTDINDCF